LWLLAATFCALLKDMFDFGHHPSAGVAHVCRRSLTASPSVRSCEARIEVFLNQCLTGANASSYSVYIGRYIILLREFAENSNNERAMDGH